MVLPMCNLKSQKERGRGKIVEEITVKNFPNVIKKIKSQIQEYQRFPYWIKANTILNPIIAKLLKTNAKENILKASKDKGEH